MASSFYDLDSGAPSEVNSLASNHPALADPVEHIPHLVTSLRDEDMVIVTESLYIVERCLKRDSFNEPFFLAMIRSPELIQALVDAIMSAFSIYNQNANILNEGNVVRSNAKDEAEAAIKRIRIASDILRAMTNPSSERQHQQIGEYRIGEYRESSHI